MDTTERIFIKPNGVIKLYNRYNKDVELFWMGEYNCYVLSTNANYISLGMDDNNQITFIDPEGGPFLEVGNYIHVNEETAPPASLKIVAIGIKDNIRSLLGSQYVIYVE